MKRVEITFRVIKDDKQLMQMRTAYALEKMDAFIDRQPLLSYAAERDAKKFWESTVLMGYLEKN